jgi:phosphoribosylpyrophosphate synthetase
LKRYGVDHVVTFAPHSQAGIDFWQQEFGERNYHPLQTTGVFAEHIRKQFPDLSSLIIGAPDGADKPDDQGQARAKQLAASACGVDEASADPYLFKIKKDHTSASETECKLISGDVAGKDCVIIDDMSDGGSTLINAAKALKDRGAKSVSVYFTHAICSNNSLHKLAANKNIDHIVTTDTVPEIIAKRDALEPELRDKVAVMSIGTLLAQKLTEISAHLGTHAARTSQKSNVMRVQ